MFTIKTAVELLEAAPKIDVQDERYFTMLHNSSAIAGTSFEGGNPQQSVDYFNQLFQISSEIIPTGLTPEESAEVALAMEDLQLFNTASTLISGLEVLRTSGNKPPQDTIPDVSKFTELIQERCKTRGYCYFPSGWTTDTGGHFAGLKFKNLGNNRFACSVINRGSGMEFHQPLAQGANKLKTDYQSYEYEIDFNTTAGKKFLVRLAQLRNDKRPYDTNTTFVKEEKARDGSTNKIEIQSNAKTIQPYSTPDLYGLLLTCGKRLPIETDVRRAATPQRTGTCSVTNVKTIAYDAIYSHANKKQKPIDKAKLQRFGFVTKFKSLIEGYKQYFLGKISLQSLAWALREFNVRIYKLYPEILTKDEFTKCSLISKVISDRIEVDKARLMADKLKPQPHPQFSGEWAEPVKEAKTPEAPMKPKPESKKNDTDLHEEKFHLNLQIQPTEMADYLERAVKYFKDINSIDRFLELRAFMHALPETSGEKQDPFWDKVPVEQIEKILKLLTEITQTKISLDQSAQAYKFEMALIAYDIAAQLAPHIPGLLLPPDITLGLSNVFLQDPIIYDPITYQTCKSIALNLKKRAKNNRVILSNEVEQDETQSYVMKTLLTSELRHKVNSILKEKQAATDIDDHELFIILMTGKCKKLDGTSIVDFPTKEILGDNFVYLLQLSGTAHSLGSKTLYYQMPDKTSNNIYFKESTAQRNAKIEEQMTDTTEPNSLVGTLNKLFPTDPTESTTLHAAIDENVIYHPSQHLQQLRSLEVTSSRGNKEKPYEIYPGGYLQLSEFGNQHVTVNEEEHEDLCSIQTNPSLQIQRILEWGKVNIEKLTSYSLQTRFSELLFGFGHLELALTEAPNHTLQLIESFLANAINYYMKRADSSDNPREKNPTNTLLWLCHLQQQLIAHVKVNANLHHLNITHLKMVNVRPYLEKRLSLAFGSEWQFELAKHIIISYQGTQITEENYLTLLKCYLIFNFKRLQRDPTYADFLIHDMWKRHYPAVVNSLTKLQLANPNEFTSQINTLAASVFSTGQNYHWHITDGLIIAEEFPYQIDLQKGLILKEGKIIQDATQNFDRFGDNKLLKLLKLLVPNLILISEKDNSHQLHTFDGSYQVYLDKFKDIKGVCRKINFKDRSLRVKLIHLGQHIHQIPIEEQARKLNITLTFETNFGKEYSYWIDEDNGTMFVEKIPPDGTAYLYDSKRGWVQYKNEHNEWLSTDNVIFNLINPSHAIEKEWAEYFKNSIGIQGVEIIGKVSKSHCEIININIKSLNLSFIPKDGHLMCNEHSGYFLSSQRSMEQLNGLSSVMILENSDGQQLILLPPFSLKSGDDNNAFNQSDFINENSLLATGNSSKYFTYKLDSSGQLVGNCLEADFYLAIIYRSQGQYLQAMRSLERSEYHTANSKALVQFVKELIKRKDKSPLGAAFDCKAICRMIRHREKWTKVSNAWEITPFDSLRDLASKQYKFYKENISEHKLGVNIIPSYLRLDSDDINTLNSIGATKASFFSTGTSSRRSEEKQTHYEFNSPRLEKLSEFLTKDKLDDRDIIWEQSRRFKENRHRRQDSTPDFNLRIFYERANAALNATKEASGYHASDAPGDDFLRTYFINLYEQALSTDPRTRNLFRLNLFFLMHNDVIYEKSIPLITALLFVYTYPQKFGTLPSFKDKLSRDCFEDVMKIVCAATKEERKACQLVDITPEAINVISHTPQKSSLLDIRAAKFSLYEDKYDGPGLDDLASEYFEKPQKSKVAQRPFALDEKEMKITTEVERSLFEYYREGHNKNQQREKTYYVLKPSIDLQTLKSKLINQIKQKRDKLKQLKDELLNLANAQLSNDEKASIDHNLCLLHVARAGEQRQLVDIDDLVYMLLNQDISQIQSNNPFLTQDQFNLLIKKTCEYLSLQIHIDQSTEAIKLIGKKQVLNPYYQQLLGENLHKQRAYNIDKYPEFLVYEYTTKTMLRPDQVKILKDLIASIENNDTDNYKHILLQFAAGGGKTSVLIPILAERFARKGFLPVIINSNELYNIGVHEIPRNLRASFRKNIEVLEIELEHQWTINELKKLASDLERWRSQRKVLLIKSSTWYSLDTTLKIAYAQSNTDLAKHVQTVLDFFKEKSVKLEDETHLISDPLQETIRTYGKMQSIPDKQQQLIMRFYDFLMNRDNDCAELAEKVGMIQFSKKTVSEDTLKEIQKELILRIIKEKKFFPGVNIDYLKYYLMRGPPGRPEWLNELYLKDPNLADVIVLARAFIKSHLPHILTLQYGKDYGKSIHKGDLTVAPKHDSQDVSSHFRDPALVLELTIQMYRQTGVPADYVKKILQKLVAEHNRERFWNKGNTTEAETFFYLILPEKYRGMTLDTLDKKLDEICRDTDIQFNKHLMERFLYVYALPPIQAPQYYVRSTPAELQAGFKRSIAFTATPGRVETYPAYLGKTFLQSEFEAEVIDTMLQEKNSECVLLDETHTASDFLSKISKESPALFAQMTTLIDRGALLSGEKAESVIKAYFEQESTRPVQAAAAFGETQLLLRSKDKKVIQDKDIDGARLTEALQQQGVEPENFLLFLFLELCRTTGTDLRRPYNDRAGVTIGKGQTMTETIQAILRERQFLCDDAQTAFWIIFKALYKVVNPNATHFDLKQVCYWMIKNEARAQTTKIIMRAYQGIDQIIEGCIRQKIKNGDESYDKFKQYLEKEFTFSAYKLYEILSDTKPTVTVLNDYTNELLHKFSLEIKDLPVDSQDRIKKIINETTQCISMMQQPQGVNLNSEVCQEQQAVTEQELEQEQKIEQQQKTNISSQFKFRRETYGQRDLLENIFSDEKTTLSRYEPLNLGIKTPQLLICYEHFDPLDTGETSQKSSSPIQRRVKPISSLLVKMNDDGKMEFVVCTTASAEFFAQQIRKIPKDTKFPAYALIGLEGDIFLSSPNLDNLNNEKFKENPAVKEMLAFAELVNGSIKDPIILSEIAKKYNWSQRDFESMVNIIKNQHVSSHPVVLSNIRRFEELCGWRVVDEKLSYSTVTATVSRPAEDALPQLDLGSVTTELPSRLTSELYLTLQARSLLPPCLCGQSIVPVTPGPRMILGY